MRINQSVMVVAALGLAGCAGSDGRPGQDGQPGAPGRPGDGSQCWDLGLERDGVCSPAEDIDGSGSCDAYDCIGAQGPVGPDGPVGPQGPEGPAGPAGPQGIQGIEGPIGPRGLQGLIGAAGPRGVTGAVGATGPAGATGPRATMIGQYEFDEVGGATVFADTSGLGNSLRSNPGGVISGSDTAHSGKSITFLGDGGLFVAPGNVIVDSAQIWPEMWIRPSGAATTYNLVEKIGAYQLRVAAGHLEWTVFTTNGPCTVSHPAAIASDTWTHVSGLYDGLTAAVEIDGVPRSTACRKGRIAPSPGSGMTVGGRLNGVQWSDVFQGNIDELRIRASTDFTVGRLSGACPPGSAMSALADGNVTCGSGEPQRVIRYKVFDTYLESCCWVTDNNPALFGGVNPSNWTDNNGQASDISPDADTLRTLFNEKMYPGANAVVSAERWKDISSTNGKVTVALLRVRNSTSNQIDWTPSFYFTAFASWGERASVALNGSNVWNTDGDYHINSSTSVTLSFPPNFTSTAIWVVPSSPNWRGARRGREYYRMTMLAFYNNSLDLPAGLSLVDDLDALSGNLW